MHTSPRFTTVMMPTLSGSIGFPVTLSRGTMGMLYVLDVTVCGFKRFGLLCLCKSDGRAVPGMLLGDPGIGAPPGGAADPLRASGRTGGDAALAAASDMSPGDAMGDTGDCVREETEAF